MKITCYPSIEKRYDVILSKAIARGARRLGHDVRVKDIRDFAEVDDTDVAVMVGVKGHSRRCFDAHLAAGRHTIYLDKGYVRGKGGLLSVRYWRAAVDAFQPVDYFFSPARRASCCEGVATAARWSRASKDIVPMCEKRDGCVVFAGSSQKYCNWHGLGDATQYAVSVLDRLKECTSRPTVYRPKPSARCDAGPVPGHLFSGPTESYNALLKNVFMLVTFGSNAAVEALFAGVPVLVLGDSPARVLGRTDVRECENPYYPTAKEVEVFARCLAWQQWEIEELASGEAMEYLLGIVKEKGG